MLIYQPSLLHRHLLFLGNAAPRRVASRHLKCLLLLSLLNQQYNLLLPVQKPHHLHPLAGDVQSLVWDDTLRLR
jgi:hypothetical protein